MLFNSWQFAIFLPIVFALYWSIPHKYRWVLILSASYYFYMCWNVKYVLLILFVTIVSYIYALLIEKHKDIVYKKRKLTTVLAICLGILFVFKYFNFVTHAICDTIRNVGVNIQPITLQLLLPVGISFYTFQAISYVIDVYRGDISAERHFGYYAAYISFFPQLVAGPIERAGNLLPQMKEERTFNYVQGTYGLKMMAWGLFKKVLVADRLAVYVDKVFNDVHEYNGLSLFIVAFFFSLQIYCDFSGYSDMAIGIAKLFGIDIMSNFKAPYFSHSIKEFWSRWHISLSNWFRDYLYIPLGGNRCNKIRNSMNLFITFLVSGLWHGANWTYIVWGAIHGILQVMEKRFIKYKSKGKISTIISTCVVFGCAMLAFVFFRANTITDATYVITHMFSGIESPMQYIKNGYIALEITKETFVLLAIPIILLCAFDFFSLKVDVIQKISSMRAVIRWGIYLLLVLLILFYIQYLNGNAQLAQKFIYFDF